jgi:N-acetylneuraminic acid mutarotase
MAHLKRNRSFFQVRLLPACLFGLLACCADEGPPDASEGLGAWASVALTDSPASGLHHTLVAGGDDVFVWGGLGFCTSQGLCGTGARFSATANAWTPLSGEQAPAARYLHSAVWTGQRMLVWGGVGCGSSLLTPCGDGAAYVPATDTWTPLASVGAPSPRGWHGAVWTGSRMLVWGGEEPASNRLFGDGALYSPEANAWTPMAASGAPSPRRYHSVVWSGRELLVWGGSGDARRDVALGDGAAWSPDSDTWRPLGTAGAPAARWAHTAVWTGRELIVWGGLGCSRDEAGQPRLCGDGARYDPETDAWTPLAKEDAPTPRSGHSAVWTGEEMLIWGGAAEQCADDTSGACQDGAAYNPTTDTWTPLSSRSAPEARSSHTAVWLGTRMFLWGGVGRGSEATLLDGALFSPGP